MQFFCRLVYRFQHLMYGRQMSAVAVVIANAPGSGTVPFGKQYFPLRRYRVGIGKVRRTYRNQSVNVQRNTEAHESGISGNSIGG